MNTNTKTKRERKAARREAVRARLETAQRDMYGNARTHYVDDVAGFTSFYEWLGDYAEREADYMAGDRFGMTSRETAAPRWYSAAARLQEARRKYPAPAYASQVRHDARNNHGFPCGPFETERAVLIRDGVGKCYSYGRNGKTFYPAAYATEDGRGFRPRDVAELSAEDTTRAVQWVEQFNAHVRSVAIAAPEAYAGEAWDSLQNDAAGYRDEVAAGRAAFAELANELRRLAGINAPAACAVLRQRLQRIRADVREAAQNLRITRASLAGLQS